MYADSSEMYAVYKSYTEARIEKLPSILFPHVELAVLHCNMHGPQDKKKVWGYFIRIKMCGILYKNRQSMTTDARAKIDVVRDAE